MEKYILFVDETSKTFHNPYFCLSGICFKRFYYEDVVTKELNDLKRKYFQSTDVIFHYSDMNNKKREFKIFKDPIVRQKFWNDYALLIKSMDFTSFGTYFNFNDMKNIYGKGSYGFYSIAFIALLKNYLHFLKSVDGIGSICIESRGFKENSILQHSYYKYLENGSMYFPHKDYDEHLASLAFIVKGDNCNGLQIVDIAPSTMLRKINNKYDYNGLGKIYTEKLYKYNTPYQDILGFKNIL